MAAIMRRQAILVVDIGTSKIKAMLWEWQQEQVLRQTQQSTLSSQIAGLPAGWSEISPTSILNLTKTIIENLIAAAPPDTKIKAITFTGAMHGILLIDEQGRPLTNLIDWRDQRVLDHNQNLNISPLDHFLSHFGDQWSLLNTGCQLASGYGLTTLYWLIVTQTLPQQPAYLCTIVDFIASQVAGSRFITDCSLAASTGLFDIIQQSWCHNFMAELGAANIKLPQIVPANTPIGAWQDIPVLAPAGDHTAAVYAVLGEAGENKAHINIGTGSQVAAYCLKPRLEERRLETRPGLTTHNYLLVSAGAVGGRTLDSLVMMLNKLLPDGSKHYTIDNLLLKAGQVSPGCDGLRIHPTFSGTRIEPTQRATMQGISPINFTPGHLTRACLEGMVCEWHQALSILGTATAQNYETLFLTGSLFSNSELLRQIIVDKLKSTVQVVNNSSISMRGMAQHAKTIQI